MTKDFFVYLQFTFCDEINREKSHLFFCRSKRSHLTALYKISKLLLRFPHQFDRKKFPLGLSSFELKFT